MSSAYYIAVQDAPEDLDTFVNGKAVSHHHRKVEATAKRMGLSSIDDLVSQNPEEARAFIVDHGGNPGDVDLPDEKWHAAVVGVDWTVGILKGLAEEEEVPTELVGDVEEFAALFEELAKRNLHWHFAIDF